jgi:hypothetical protein
MSKKEPIVILGLDPGGWTRPDKPTKGKPGTGYAILKFIGETVALMAQGVFDYTPDRLREWISLSGWRDGEDTAISEVPQFRGRPTCHDAVKNQGVCESFGGTPYNPSKIHSFFGTKNKKDIERVMRRVLGDHLPEKVSDHVTDAIAVALYHAAQINVWQPRIEAMPAKPQGACYKRGGVRVDLSENPTQEELREALRTGKAWVGR